MVTCRYFAVAREIVGTSVEHYDHPATVEGVLKLIIDRHGEPLRKILATSAIWLNGEPATLDMLLSEDDEVAILPPVSGGT